MAKKLPVIFCSIIIQAAVWGSALAVPPLVAGDVAVADKNHIEWYLGTRYQKEDSIERQVPFTEIVYGVSGRQEITLEVPYIVKEGNNGFGDATLGTKFLFLRESDKDPGIAGSFEVKLDNGNDTKGLGTGAPEYDLRLRAQKRSAGWFTGIVNLGHTFVGEPEVNGVRIEKRDVWFAAFAQEYELSGKTSLLSEVYWKTNDEPRGPFRLAADVGFKRRISDNLWGHGAIGKSLREGNTGGPGLRVYLGVKYEFAVN